MSTGSLAPWQTDFGMGNGAHPGFVGSKEELARDGRYAGGLEEAFDRLELDGMFCSAETPLVYFKEVEAINDAEARALHQKFWNHGTAPILVLVAPESVHIYSGMTRPEPMEGNRARPRCLVGTLERVADKLETFLVSVESGAYFREHEASFDADSRVDRDLLSNLTNARAELCRGIEGEDAEVRLDALLCRLVFACYLFDRKVIGEGYLRDLGVVDCAHLRDVLGIRPAGSAKAALYKLFRQLGDDFNGDLFSDDLVEEERLVRDEDIETLCDFFHGTDVRTRQKPFWPYDFGYIPVETVSAIYERFLRANGNRDGAFYTARFLAEIVLDTALEGARELIGKTFLDPACGSGIFLVGLFNRLAWEWTRAHPGASNEERARELIGVLRESVFGVDKNRVACRIAAFSLYLAYLDQLSPRDIRELQRNGPSLPRLVDESGKAAHGSKRNIMCSDFFAADLLSPASFDFVVGNPPWGSVEKGVAAEQWCIGREKIMPDRQIATAFVWKAVEHARAGAPVSFVLPHGTLFNHGDKALKFQRAWFEAYRVERVLNLTDLRFFLFREAIHPAIVVRYRNGPPDEGQGVVEYWTPKASWAATKADVIAVGPGDRSALAVAEVMKDLRSADAPQVWNRHFWATPRDLRLLDRLMTVPRLRDHIQGPGGRVDSGRWVIAEGVQPIGRSDDPSRAKRLELPSRRFIDAKSPGIDLFLQADDCTVLPSRTYVARQKSNSYTGIFKAPHVLVTQGFKRVAFADFDVGFRHAVRGIHGPAEDRELLMFLACYLRSRLARYFAFHTSSNWGVYRPKVHVDELMRLPFPLPDQMDDSTARWNVVREIGRILESARAEAERSFFSRANAVATATSRIEPLVNEYFGIADSDQVLIADTVDVVAPSAQPGRNMRAVAGLAATTREQGLEYIKRICETLNQWAASSGQAVRGTCAISGSLGVGAALLEIGHIGEESGPLDVGSDLLHVLRRIRDALAVDGGSLSTLREVMVFEGDKLYMLKPAARSHWTETAALNDADTLAATLFSNARSGVG